MGGAVSSGKNNDELIDNLCHENYIQTPQVEKVFRQIDRAHFMIFPEDQDNLEAYEDHAWRRNTLHLSAPCIYTRAMEALKLERGVSFLNIGSGTGYFSTMAGLLIGPYGINHGIEIYPENIEFAEEKVEEFRTKDSWYDPLNFCDPLFVVGNGLLLSPGNILYDRIYCGAACPPEHAQLMKNMLNVGGILVMPYDNQLESISRVSETEWHTEVILPSVSFAPLILPSQESVKDLAVLEIAVQPLPLKQFCRLQVLKNLGRERYSEIPALPLPQHLKDYVAHYKTWFAPREPPNLLCPLDHSKDKRDSKTGKEEGASSDTSRQRDGARGRGSPNLRGMPSLNINGREVLICNFNGIYFQIPIESDDNASGDNDASGDNASDGDNEGSGRINEDTVSMDNPSDENSSEANSESEMDEENNANQMESEDISE